METIKIWLDFLQSFLWVSMFWFLLIVLRRPLHHFLDTMSAMIQTRGVKLTPSGVEIPSSKNKSIEFEERPLPHDIATFNQLSTDPFQNKDKETEHPLLPGMSSEDFLPFLRLALEDDVTCHDIALFQSITTSLELWVKHQKNEGEEHLECLKQKLIRKAVALYLERWFSRSRSTESCET